MDITEQDRKNYSPGHKSPFEHCPEKFLQVGDRVRARFRIWDQPNIPAEFTTNGKEWGWVTAEEGELGTVEHVEEGYWPTVRFEKGRASCVFDYEVEKI